MDDFNISIQTDVNETEESKVEEQKEILELPLIALRGRVLFPKTALNFDVGRPMSVKAASVA